MAFPSLSNAVLEKLGLYGHATRNPLDEQGVEQKFTSLALAFTIDAATIKDRCNRQRRNRNQNESNFNLEVEKLKEKMTLLQPLCTDFESADLLSTLFSQLETLTNAASHVSISAERYGAVQHEERLTESVQLMVSHVQTLKQQRDSALRQLQYTKRVLHEPVISDNQKLPQGLNKVLMNKRRASTDSVCFSSLDPNFKLSRKVSDLSMRATLSKNRQSRLELGKELNEIREMTLDESSKDENNTIPGVSELQSCDFDSDFESTGGKTSFTCDTQFVNEISTLVRLKFSSYTEDILRRMKDFLKKWSEDGYLYAFLNSCAVLCFSVSILTLASIFLEQEYTKSSTYWLFPWLKKK
ncbi:hypothetical protein ABEB36_005032 [Hypothenemus hampei]